MAYNSVDRYQLKAGTRPFPLLHASAVTNTMRHARGAVVFVSICRICVPAHPYSIVFDTFSQALCVGMPRWLMRCSGSGHRITYDPFGSSHIVGRCRLPLPSLSRLELR